MRVKTVFNPSIKIFSFSGRELLILPEERPDARRWLLTAIISDWRMLDLLIFCNTVWLIDCNEMKGENIYQERL